MEIRQISATDAASGLSAGKLCLLDVREPWEVQTASVADALTIPMNDVPEKLDELRSACAGKNLVVMCHSGQRSSVIVRFLNQAGLDGVFNLEGGIAAWSLKVDPSVPSY